jgi:RimJ/RimL family protein N-acetyltransferase
MAPPDIEAMLRVRAALEAPEHFDPVRHRRELETLWALFNTDWKLQGIGHLLVLARLDRQIVGHVRMKGFARDNGSKGAEVAFGIDELHRGNGYAAEALAAALLMAFEIAGVDPVVAMVEPGNEPSLKVLHRNGFQRVGKSVAYNRPMERHMLSRASWDRAPAARRA